MTPLQIKILLHYHAFADDYPDLSSPSQQEAIAYFLEEGFLIKPGPSEETYFKATAKLHFYCDYLCSIPEPVSRFEIPEPQAISGGPQLGAREFATLCHAMPEDAGKLSAKIVDLQE